jgi:hypothetical protein
MHFVGCQLSIEQFQAGTCAGTMTNSGKHSLTGLVWMRGRSSTYWGHSDLETTLRYLKSASQETKGHCAKLEAAFGGQKRARAIAASKS